MPKAKRDALAQLPADDASRQRSAALLTDPPTPEIDKLLCFTLYITARASEAKYRPVLSALGLTYPRYIALLVLRDREGISLGTLGDHLQLDSATLSPLLKGMEADGLLSRRRNPADERSLIVTLTDKGREVASQAIRAADALACSIDLDPAEADRIREDIRRVHTALQSPGK